MNRFSFADAWEAPPRNRSDTAATLRSTCIWLSSASMSDKSSPEIDNDLEFLSMGVVDSFTSKSSR